MSNNWAIVIGINHYDHHPERQLNYAVPDAQLIYDFLCNHAGFAPDHILLCLGDQEYRTSSSYPTYPTLLRLLNRELHPDRIGKVDRLWFFFGGHGVSQNGRDYLLTSDSLLEDIELKIALPIDEVIASMRRHQAADIVLILDNCRQQQGSRKFVADDIGKQTIELAQSRGITTIFSCDYGQYSYELASLKQGTFTYALVEGLKQYTLPYKLEPYLRRRVAELNQRSDQIPRIRVEPASKAFQPLLPSAVTPADISVLVDRAIDAELEGNFEAAKQGWWQVIEGSPSVLQLQEARMAIDRIDRKIAQLVDRSESTESPKHPEAASDTRRLDAAMPNTCKVRQKTEVRVMIALPDSIGLKKYLPDYTEVGDLISKKDVNQSTFPFIFPKDPVTGEPKPFTIFISINAPDFEVEQSIKDLYLSPDQDSGVVTFFIAPKIKQSRARVCIEVFKNEQRTILLGSLTLIIEVFEQQSVLSQVVWQLVKLPIRLFESPPIRSSLPEASLSPAPPPRPESERISIPPSSGTRITQTVTGNNNQAIGQVTGGQVFGNFTGGNSSGADEVTLPTPKTILILAANPRGTSPLQLGEEVRDIQAGLDRARQRDRFVLVQQWAVSDQEVRRALLDYSPHIVHFSGHGMGTADRSPSESPSDSRKLTAEDAEASGLVLENAKGQPQLVSGEALADLFALFADRIECIVLNACYSATQAQAIAQHIPYVVGMKQAIGDAAAIQFSVGFYDAILAGKSIEFAYHLGCNAVQTAGIPEHLTPILHQSHP